jgi:ABC-type microcin C transport system duplicated ATPase subunit YejF
MPLLECEHLVMQYDDGRRSVRGVDDVSLAIEAGETVGLIGESGSGKSTLGQLVLGLLQLDGGSIVFDGERIDRLDMRAMRRVRRRMHVVFQEPFESLNPRLSVGRSVGEPLELQASDLSRGERSVRVGEMLEEVGLPPSYAARYPVELSGGEQQRVGIARAMVLRPKLVVLDEPTSSLDLSVQAGILRLLRDLQLAHALAYLFVSHDIGTVELMSDRVHVMHAGRIVESGTPDDVLRAPQHERTRELLDARLPLDVAFA